MRMKQNELLEKIVDNYPNLKYSLLEAQTFDEEHYGFPPIYYKIMETDFQRVQSFKKAFSYYHNLQDSIVCEIGVGTLPLTRLYMPFVKKAYLIENNPDLVPYIQEEIKKNGWSDKVEVIFDDALSVTLPESVDYIIGELMSIFCINEYQVPIFKHMRQFLKETGKLIPNRILNFARLCYCEFDDHSHYPVMFTRHQPMILSQQFSVNEIQLHTVEDLEVNQKIQVSSLLSGKINALYMESYVELAPTANFTGTDSLMPPTVFKAENEIEVKQNDIIEATINFKYGTSLDYSKCTLKVL